MRHPPSTSTTNQIVRLACRINAEPTRVYDFFCDHESFGRIWPGTIKRIKDSDEPGNPNGLGSVRSIQLGPIVFEETHITCQRPQRIQYTVTRGGPIKNHLGTIDFIAEDDGTRIDYTISFDPRIPLTGCLIARSLKRDWERGIQPIIAELNRG